MIWPSGWNGVGLFGSLGWASLMEGPAGPPVAVHDDLSHDAQGVLRNYELIFLNIIDTFRPLSTMFSIQGIPGT